MWPKRYTFPCHSRQNGIRHKSKRYEDGRSAGRAVARHCSHIEAMVAANDEMASVRRPRKVSEALESSAVDTVGRPRLGPGVSDDISPYRACRGATDTVGRPTKASAAQTGREGRQRHLRRLSLVRHLRGFAPVGGGGEARGEAAPGRSVVAALTTGGPAPPGTHLRTVRMRLLDDGSRRKQRRTVAAIATMKRYFPRSRRLIIIFSHQDGAPPGRTGAGGAARAGRAGRRAAVQPAGRRGWRGLAHRAVLGLAGSICSGSLCGLCRLGGGRRCASALASPSRLACNYNADAGGRYAPPGD